MKSKENLEYSLIIKYRTYSFTREIYNYFMFQMKNYICLCCCCFSATM